jgi:hypothetical protein
MSECEWTCGHHASAMCAECYRILAQRANELAEENLILRALTEAIGECWRDDCARLIKALKPFARYGKDCNYCEQQRFGAEIAPILRYRDSNDRRRFAL